MMNRTIDIYIYILFIRIKNRKNKKEASGKSTILDFPEKNL